MTFLKVPEAIDIIVGIRHFGSVHSLPLKEQLAICTILEEPSQRSTGAQYPPAYLKAWAKLCGFARLVDAQKGVAQWSNLKPKVELIPLLQQLALEFGVEAFTPPTTLVSVLKNLHKNGVPNQFSKATYTITELSTLTHRSA